MNTTRFPMAAALTLLLMAPASVSAEVLLEHQFNQPIQSFSGTDGFVSRYCSDPWTTVTPGWLSPLTDNGCQCQSGQQCDWGMWIDGGYCYNSDPTDNHIVVGDPEWTDYLFEADFLNSDDDTLGLVFRYTNSGSYYLLTFSRDQTPAATAAGCNEDFTGARLIRNSYDGNAVSTELLATSEATYTVGKKSAVAVLVEGTHILVGFDGQTIFDVVDDSPVALPAGKVGFFAFENGLDGNADCQQGGCGFDYLKVSTLPSVVPDGGPEPTPEPVPETQEDIGFEQRPERVDWGPEVLEETGPLAEAPDVPAFPDTVSPGDQTGPSPEVDGLGADGIPTLEISGGSCSVTGVGAGLHPTLALSFLFLLSIVVSRRRSHAGREDTCPPS